MDTACYLPVRLDDGGQDQDSKPRAFFKAAQFASLGLEMGLAVAIGAGIGYWLDTRLGTKPWLLLFFLLCGVAAGFKGVFDAARRASTDETASKPRDRTPGPPQDSSGT
jgi:ATP synthase protein I